jgi:DNA invertase Pin-like site-specific DNA recombinase
MLNAQLESLYRAAERMQMEVIGEFSEIVGARAGYELPQLEEAIAFASRNKANLLVLRIDRFGTDVDTMRDNLERIGRMGVRVWLESGAIVDPLTIETLREFKRKERYRSPNKNPSPLKGKPRTPRQ